MFIFDRKNYRLMLIGLLLIGLGFILMSGADANTNPKGIYDKNYFNEDIFSFRRIRLAPIFIITGFIVQIFGILSAGEADNEADNEKV
ncbi:DUF3098 domain-containing protein [Bacteroidetes bacterium endosymbiont of Geopemphigus sp.]|nr:DUF3098 domain-containing protein [Bacteroidetes bacterium endosymbiont of Geopemphigus sp.]